jgi:hypothetical protein
LVQTRDDLQVVVIMGLYFRVPYNAGITSVSNRLLASHEGPAPHRHLVVDTLYVPVLSLQ